MFITNYPAILVAGIASMVLGSLWYSPLLFGKAWMGIMGFTESDIEAAREKGMAKNYLIAFIGTLLIAFAISCTLNLVKPLTMATGIRTSALVWLGFIVPILINPVLWENRPWKLFFLNASFHLASLVIMGIVLTAWR